MDNIITALINYNKQNSRAFDLNIFRDMTKHQLDFYKIVCFDRQDIERWFKTGLLENELVTLSVKNGVLNINCKYSHLDNCTFMFKVNFFNLLPEPKQKVPDYSFFYSLAKTDGCWNDHYYSSVMSISQHLEKCIEGQLEYALNASTEIEILEKIVRKRLSLSTLSGDDGIKQLKAIGYFCHFYFLKKSTPHNDFRKSLNVDVGGSFGEPMTDVTLKDDQQMFFSNVIEHESVGDSLTPVTEDDELEVCDDPQITPNLLIDDLCLAGWEFKHNLSSRALYLVKGNLKLKLM